MELWGVSKTGRRVWAAVGLRQSYGHFENITTADREKGPEGVREEAGR